MAKYAVGDKVRVTYEFVIKRIGPCYSGGEGLFFENNRSFSPGNEEGSTWSKKVELIESPLRAGDTIKQEPFQVTFKILYIDDHGAFIQRQDGLRYPVDAPYLKNYTKVVT